jgi:hypothetical protein
MEQAAWDERYAGADMAREARPNRFVAEEVTPLPPGRARDLGTGEGRNAIWHARVRHGGAGRADHPARGAGAAAGADTRGRAVRSGSREAKRPAAAVAY